MSKIVRHSYGIKTERDELELNRMAFRDSRRREDNQAIMESNQRIAQIESRDNEELFIRNTLDRDVLRRKVLHTSNTILEQGKLFAFKYLMADCYKKSLVIDDYFVKENTEKFDELVSNYIDKNGGFAMLENAIKANPIPLLVEMKKVCEQASLKTTKRITKEMEENPELSNIALFEMNEEEKDEFYTKSADLSMDKLAELVKNKVLTVVKDERDRQSKQKELMDDLEARAKETGEPVQESRIMGEPNLKESTLFNSIFHNSYKEALESMIEATKEHLVPDYRGEDQEDDEEYEEFDVQYTKDDLEEDTPSSDDIVNPLVRDIDLDLILTESITYYTLLELNHTMCLETFNRTDIQNLSHKLLNGK